jgi:hypothetical protein
MVQILIITCFVDRLLRKNYVDGIYSSAQVDAQERLDVVKVETRAKQQVYGRLDKLYGRVSSRDLGPTRSCLPWIKIIYMNGHLLYNDLILRLAKIHATTLQRGSIVNYYQKLLTTVEKIQKTVEKIQIFAGCSNKLSNFGLNHT